MNLLSSLFLEMERVVGNPGDDITVENPGVDITSAIEIYWVDERRWMAVCLDTHVLSITHFAGGESGTAEVLW